MRFLTLHRIHHRWGATIGALFLDGQYQCWTLEDPPRKEKIPGETRIPPGVYDVELRTAGGMHARYRTRFPEWHRGMLWLRDVPDYEWVYIHIGNFLKDTAGCPLVGRALPSPVQDSVLDSTAAYQALYEQVVDAAAKHELSIEVCDEWSLEWPKPAPAEATT